MLDDLIKAIVGVREKEAIEIVTTLLSNEESPLNIIDACTKAMKQVGELFESGEYFLPELLMTGEILSQITEKVKPIIAEEIAGEKQGRVLIGTVKGDVHDLGKNIVTFLLDVNGFEVKDIGVDVSSEKFVEEIIDFQPHVVGMSGLLTLAFDSMKETMEAISRAGLKDKIKIMIGGGQTSKKVCDYIGADAFGKNALEGVSLAKKWIQN